MSNITVTNISGLSSSPVYFEHGIAGNGFAMSFSPEVLSFTPVPNSIDQDQNTNINIVFDQPIQFSLTDPGIIELRSNSPSGTLIESFNTQNPGSQLTITQTNVVDDTLTINPISQLPDNTNVFVVIPNVGIANTFGGLYKGTDKYSFKTLQAPLNATGGTYVFTRSDSSSPTAYYKYHVFVGTGSLYMNVPMKSCPTFNLLCVAGGGSGGPGYSPTQVGGGGGGAGGVISGSKSQLAEIPAGNHIITVGGGGSNNPSSESYQGSPSSIGDLFEAIGGGRGGSGPTPYAYLLGGDGGSGGGGAGSYQMEWSHMYGNPYPYPTRGHVSFYGGQGGGGQGNPGGRGWKGHMDPQPQRGAGGGGGGAGGNGENASGPTYGPPGYPYPQYGNHPLWHGKAGNGGSGRAEPVFRSPNISPQATGLPNQWQNEVGPQGYYGGGGGGGCPNNASYLHAGNGGAGGGGHGSRNNYPYPNYPPSSYHTNDFTPSYPTQPERTENGTEHTGGGGGGSGGTHYSTYPGGAGGSGIVIIRYSIPSTLA